MPGTAGPRPGHRVARRSFLARRELRAPRTDDGLPGLSGRCRRRGRVARADAGADLAAVPARAARLPVPPVRAAPGRVSKTRARVAPDPARDRDGRGVRDAGRARVRGERVPRRRDAGAAAGGPAAEPHPPAARLVPDPHGPHRQLRHPPAVAAHRAGVRSADAGTGSCSARGGAARRGDRPRSARSHPQATAAHTGSHSSRCHTQPG